MKKKIPLRFEYKNWEGEIAVRKVEPIKLWYGSTQWHLKDGWLFKAKDLEKDVERDFAVKNIIQFL